MQNSCLKTSAWWSRGSHCVENGYLSLRFPNMVKVNIDEHRTRVTRFNPLWVSGTSNRPFARNGHALRTIFAGGKRNNAVRPWKEWIHTSFWMISSQSLFPSPTASRSLFSSTGYIWDKGRLSHLIYISITNRTFGLTFYGRTDEKSTIISFRAERFYDSACWLNVTKTIIGRRPATSWSDQVAWIYLSPSLIVCGF